LLRILPERALNVDEELCACFIDLQKAFDRVNWTKLLKIIEGTGINLRKHLDQKQMENVEYFKYIKSSIKMMQQVHVKFNSGFP
jgi:hypothetical protein